MFLTHQPLTYLAFAPAVKLDRHPTLSCPYLRLKGSLISFIRGPLLIRNAWILSVNRQTDGISDKFGILKESSLDKSVELDQLPVIRP